MAWEYTSYGVQDLGRAKKNGDNAHGTIAPPKEEIVKEQLQQDRPPLRSGIQYE
jgi:hypothetical protein